MYFTQGAAIANSSQNIITTTPTDHFGLVISGGAEAKLGGGWIARAEYLHYDFGAVWSTNSQVIINLNPPGTFSDHPGRQTIGVVRGGISYKF